MATSKQEGCRFPVCSVAWQGVFQTRYNPGLNGAWSAAALALLWLLFGSATATADEFCGPDVKPPAELVTLSARPCCTEQTCVCDSKICGGESVAIQDESLAPSQAPDRIPAVGRRILNLPAHPRARTTIESEVAREYLPDPPVPPPPRERS